MALFPIVSSLGLAVDAGNPFALATSPTLFGDGSDGDVVIAVNTTLTRDMQYRNLTVNAGIVLTTAGFSVRVQETATINGTVRNNGGAGGTGTPGAAGAGAPAGSLGGGSAGGAGGNLGAGVNGVASNPVFAAGAGGRGGNSATNVAAGAGGAVQGATVLPILGLDEIQALGAKVGGAGGGGGAGQAGNYGGGGGGGGGIILLMAAVLAGIGTIEANGGAGGNGNAQASGGAGGGGGGGLVALVYQTKTFSGVAQAAGGATGLDTVGQLAQNAEQPGSPGAVVERQAG